MATLLARLFMALLALSVASVPVSAFAQSGPPGMPSYAVPAPPSDQETIHGHIASVDDPTTLHVNDDRGFVDSVQLDQGTIINPSGAQLQPGMAVTITGVSRGSFLAANEIDIGDGSVQPAQPAALPPPASQMQPPPGTEFSGNIGTALDSKDAFAGEQVILQNVSADDGSIRGASMIGTVTDVTRPGEGRKAQIRIHFDSLRLPDGTLTPIDGIVVSMQVKTKSNAAKELGGAVLGMLAGNAIGKTLFGVSGGGIVGAVGGFMIAKDNQSDVVIPANTTVIVRLVSRRRQAE